MSNIAQLLQQIADNTANDSSIWIAVVSGGAAVLGASISAVFSFFMMKQTTQSQEKLEERRLKANVVVTERLRWLQDIRERLADLYCRLDMQYNLIQRPVSDQEKIARQLQIDEFSQQIMEQINIITLMLNPENDDQKLLRNKLQDVLAYMQQCFEQTNANAQQFDNDKYTKLNTGISLSHCYWCSDMAQDQTT